MRPPARQAVPDGAGTGRDGRMTGYAAGSAPPTASPWGPAHRALTTGMVTLIALTAFEALAVTTAMPVVVAELGGRSLYALAFAAPVASGVVGMVVAGSWTDRRGPTRPLLSGTALFVVGLLAAGLSGSMAGIVLGRLVQGLGAGTITVALYVLVARVYPPRAHAAVFAAFAAAWVLPALVGPALAGLVVETIGWRWVFLGVPALAVPAVALLVPALRGPHGRGATGGPTSAGEPRPHLDGAGVDDTHDAPAPVGAVDHPVPGARRRVLLALGAGAGALALHAAGGGPGAAGGAADGGTPRPVALVGLVVGTALLAVTLRPLLPAGTLRGRAGLPAVIALRGLVGAAFFSAEVYLPLMLVERRGLSAGTAGLALTAAALLWSLGSWLRGREDARVPDRVVLVAGAAAIVLGIVVSALALVPAVPVPVAVAGWAVAGLGMGLLYPTLALLTLRLSPPAEQGANSSALQVAESLGIVLLLAVTAAVAAALAGRGPDAGFAGVLALAATVAVVATVLAPRAAPAPAAARAPATADRATR